jgi:UDP-GlcNAc:undecaprenyl-phosphate GlcNAc-1-phosphate transferase
MDYLILFLLGFSLSTLLAYGVLFLFPRIGLMDRPHLYGLTRKAVPYPGGVVIASLFSLFLFFFFPHTQEFTAFLVGGLLLAVVCFIDDRKRLSPFLRLAMQLLVALIVILGGIGITHISNPFGGSILLDTFQIPFTIFGTTYHFTVLSDLFTMLWLILIINSVNWLDGIPGLTSGIGAISSFILFALSLLLVYSTTTTAFEKESAMQIAQMAILFCGITAAFARFDFHPAKMIIGDTGTMFIGYTLAVLSIFSGGKVATIFLVLGFPILDAFWVIMRRLLQGKSPFKGDLEHFPHRLLALGLSERSSILVIYTLCALFGCIALLLLSKGPHSKLIAILGMALLMATIAGYFLFLERKRRTQ